MKRNAVTRKRRQPVVHGWSKISGDNRHIVPGGFSSRGTGYLIIRRVNPVQNYYQYAHITNYNLHYSLTICLYILLALPLLDRTNKNQANNIALCPDCGSANDKTDTTHYGSPKTGLSDNGSRNGRRVTTNRSLVSTTGFLRYIDR